MFSLLYALLHRGFSASNWMQKWGRRWDPGCNIGVAHFRTNGLMEHWISFPNHSDFCPRSLSNIKDWTFTSLKIDECHTWNPTYCWFLGYWVSGWSWYSCAVSFWWEDRVKKTWNNSSIIWNKIHYYYVHVALLDITKWPNFSFAMAETWC